MIVLADTSVWIDHWRRGNPRFASLLAGDLVLVHPFVVGELALGVLDPRPAVLEELKRLRTARLADHEEVLGLVERRGLWNRGLGWIDVHLLASAMLERAHFWSLDKPVARAAADLGLALASVR